MACLEKCEAHNHPLKSPCQSCLHRRPIVIIISRLSGSAQRRPSFNPIADKMELCKQLAWACSVNQMGRKELGLSSHRPTASYGLRTHDPWKAGVFQRTALSRSSLDASSPPAHDGRCCWLQKFTYSLDEVERWNMVGPGPSLLTDP